MAAHRAREKQRQSTLGIGGGEAVVGIFDRERLSAGLVATHRAGFGPHARVLDPSRGDLTGQLQRAGFPNSIEPGELGASDALILVTAPGRAAAVEQTLTQAGARHVHVIRRAPATSLLIPIPEDTAETPLLDVSPQAGDGIGA